MGECDYTGFSFNGSMKLYVSKSIKRIYKYGISSKLDEMVPSLKEINIF